MSVKSLECMAKLIKNIIMEGLSGMIGKQLVIVTETKGNRQYIRSRPEVMDKSKRSTSQKDHLKRFYTGAVHYWNQFVKKNPDLVAEYKAAAPAGLNAYNMVIKDYMNLPSITKITLAQPGRAGKPVIKIVTKCVFRLQNVSVCHITE